MRTKRRNHDAAENFRRAVSDRIRELETTPVAVAERAGIGYPFLYRILSGDQVPTLRTAEKVAKALDLRIETVAN